jgi:hypothetical protein
LRWLAVLVVVFPRLASAGNFYSGISPATVPWPGGIVPYEFTNTLTAAQKQTFMDGLREWELAANVTYVPHTNQTHWVMFTYNTNWIDNVSDTTNPQVVTVASLSRAQVCHEMGHSFGFTHENIRPDATNFITVLTNNINEPSNIFFFTIDPTSVTNGSYDFESVMHLGWDFESTNFGVAPTQTPKPPYFPRYQFRMGNFCLSPGDRAALAYLYGPPAVPLTNIVTTTLDSGPGSLRAALYYIEDHPGTVVSFNIPNTDPGYSNGVYNIHLSGCLPPLADNGMVIDGSTQPGFAGRPLIVVDGSQIIPETQTSTSGLLIYSSSNQVKDVSFSGFNWNGLTFEYADATNNTIAGCWLGLGPGGTNAAPNAYQGILIGEGAGHNVIGGTNAAARNVISGNSQYGIYVSDTNAPGNVILGDYIGTDPGGSFSVSNLVGGIAILTNGVGEVIGGTAAGAGNLISGNGGAGIFLSGAGVSNNIVCGNDIGLNAAGAGGAPDTAAIFNSSGIEVTAGASSNAILDNVISSNYVGLFISDPGTAGNLVAGNFIGTDITGRKAVANGYEGLAIANGAGPNLIGGTTAGARNIISGNYYGVVITGPDTGGNVIEGNFIGPDVSGTNEVPGVYEGLALGGSAVDNTIGGTAAGAGNVISGNYFDVVVRDPGTGGNLFQGNFIGPDATGKAALTNQYEGFALGNEASSNFIGGTVAGAGNLISGDYVGVYIGDTNTSANLFQGNLIGVDVTGTNALGNGYLDVEFANGANDNIVGEVAPGAGNVIANAAVYGVALYNAGTTNNAVRGNTIYSNSAGGIYLDGFNAVGPGVLPGPNDLQNYPVITNAYGHAATTIVSGTFSSLTNRTFFIDVYRNPARDPSGQGQGRFYVGTVSVTTDGSGNATFALTNTTGNYAGQVLSATATSAGGDTSEFSADVTATNTPSATFNGPFVLRPGGFVLGLTLATNFGYHLQAATNLAAPITWVNLTNFTATSAALTFTDRTATNFPARYYRVTSP